MPIPASYQRASVEFEKFMVDARDIAGLATTNMAYNMVVGVLHTFRRRLSVQEAIGFANVLPAVLSAIFVSDWDPSEAKAEFTDRTAMTQEVKSLRAEHNFSPDTAIHDVATALRRNVIQPEFDHYLASLSVVAQDYWCVDR